MGKLHLKQIFKKSRRNSGFSLIEVSIILVIIGLLTYPLLSLYNSELEQKKVFSNIVKFNEITDKVNDFVKMNGRYPVPSSLVASFSDSDYGQEASGTAPNCSGWPGNSGVNGICDTGGADGILIGAVPFKALGIPPDSYYDYWGNKILYAVTKAQSMSYVANAGEIEARGFDASGALVTIYNDVDIILVSSGETANGAYTKDGILVAACPNSSATKDSENCDMDGVFILKANETIFPAVGSTSLGSGNSDFYDDLTLEQRRVPASLWLQNLNNPNFALTFANMIGIGTTTPTAKVHVIGDVRSDNVLSDAICDFPSASCFDPEIITGSEPDMNCRSGNGLTGDQAVLVIANSRVDCASPIDRNAHVISGDISFEFPSALFAQVNCLDTGRMMVGIDSSGVPICVNP